jgi:O-antigen/teichoic acid export membrane protein
MGDGDGTQPSTEPAGTAESWKSFLVPKAHRVAEFLAWQGTTMAGNLLYGFLCVRLLPIAEYAKFVVVFAIQGSLVVLMDVGISSSVVALVGDRIEDRQLIADYIASLRQLAHWLYAIVAPITVLIYPLLVRNRHWSWQTVAFMVGVLLISVWFARVGGAYGAVLILRRDRRRWYQTQMVSSFGTLIILIVFLASHWLNAYTAILINVAGVIYVGATYYIRSRQLLGVNGVASKQKRGAIIHLALPVIPSVIYFAIQGPLTVLLITIFGKTSGVASLGALTRLGQVFTLFSQMNPMLVEPYFARLPRQQLKSHYFAAVAVAGGFGLLVAGLSRVFPEAFLWILGAKYAGLRFEVFQVMIASSMGLVSGVMNSINVARRFNYHWDYTTRNIVTLIIQIIFIWKADLSSVRNVLWLSIFSGVPSLMLFVIAAVYGCVRGPRRIPGADGLNEAS